MIMSRDSLGARRFVHHVVGVVAMLIVAGTASAHGGDDHGLPPPPPAPGSAVRSAHATTTALELVVRWPDAATAEGAQRFRVVASHYSTNAPVEGAAITLDFQTPPKTAVSTGSSSKASSGVHVQAQAYPSTSPGIYEATVTLPDDGVYELSATVTAGELLDVAALGPVVVGSASSADVSGGPVRGQNNSSAQDHEHDHDHEHDNDHAHDDAHGVRPWMFPVMLGGGAIALAVMWLRTRRRRTRTSSGPAAFMLMLTAVTARAHGGDEHAVETNAQPTVRLGGNGARVTLSKESQFLLGVRTVLVGRHAIADRVSVPGIITAPPERHAAILVPQSGRIAPPRVGFPQLGAVIKKGQVLGIVEAVLSAPDRAAFLAEEARARADATSAQARVSAAEKARARLESLTGVTTKQQLEAADVELASARAAVEDARARIAAFSTTAGVSRFELTSPLDGVLADIDVSPGETLNQGDRAFLVIDPSTLTVAARIPEHELGRLASAVDAVVMVDAFPGRAFPATLLAQGQVIDDATRTAKVVFSVQNKARLLKLGMFAQVHMSAREEAESTVGAEMVAVPDAALLDVDGRRVVYVHTAPEEFEQREVAVGRRDGAYHEVVRGLAVGERVVVQGAYSLRSAPAR